MTGELDGIPSVVGTRYQQAMRNIVRCSANDDHAGVAVWTEQRFALYFYVVAERAWGYLDDGDLKDVWLDGVNVKDECVQRLRDVTDRERGVLVEARSRGLRWAR